MGIILQKYLIPIGFKKNSADIKNRFSKKI